jgi:hypothetical protein
VYLILLSFFFSAPLCFALAPCSHVGLGLQLPPRAYHREPLGPANFKLACHVVCNSGGISGAAEISDSAGGPVASGGLASAVSHRVAFREAESESKAEYCVGEKVDASEGMMWWCEWGLVCKLEF